jgi:hypothetical protein
MTTHVAERVVPHDGEVPQRAGVLHSQRGDLLAEPGDAVGQGLGPRQPSVRRLAPQGDDGERTGTQRHHDRDDVEDPHAERA